MRKSQFKEHNSRFEETESIFLDSLEIGENIKPGQKIPLIAKNSERVTKGRRFAYIGIDNQIHVGRIGKSLKVNMLLEIRN